MVRSEPFVSIIVVNFNGTQWLKECFQSLEQLRYPRDCFEVIMGDNASTDHSVEWTRQNFPGIKIIQFDKNYGFCKANNLCAQQAKGEYIAFLNNDAFVTPDWLGNLVKAAQSDPNVKLCASKIFFPHLKEGRVLNAAGGIFLISGLGLDIGFLEDDSAQYGIQNYTAFGCGAGILVQRDFFINTGGFDEYLFHSSEDADFAYRVWLYGYKVLYVPSAVMYHYLGRTISSGKGIAPLMFFLITRNSIYFILKNYEWSTAIKGLLLLKARIFFRIFYSLFTGNANVLKMAIRGYFFALRDIRRTLKIRRLTQAHRRISDSELVRSGILTGAWQTLKLTLGREKKLEQYGVREVYDKSGKAQIHIDEKGEFSFYQS